MHGGGKPVRRVGDGERAAGRGRGASGRAGRTRGPFSPPLMNNILRTLLAGYGAKKLGGGCFSTVLIFVVLFVLLGQCGASMPPADDAPADRVEVAAPAAIAR